MEKIIIWGHKNNGHTHGHIHSSYYKVFKYLGYDTHWFDDNEDVSNFNFDNCIFLTEDQAQKNIPLNKTCKYILHHTNLDKYNANGLTYINLANYLKLCNEGVSAYHKENKVVKIAELCYWDEVTKTIYQPWATDLTPDEINIESAIKGNVNEKNIYYIGTSHDNTKQLTEFNSTAIANGKQLIVGKTNTDKENLDLIRQSYLSVDIRGDWHVECGYLPCRVFKNISYGRITGTNSKHVKDVLGEHVVYDENPAELFNKLVEAEQNQSVDDIKNAMKYIKDNHTFVNRINNLLKVI